MSDPSLQLVLISIGTYTVSLYTQLMHEALEMVAVMGAVPYKRAVHRLFEHASSVVLEQTRRVVYGQRIAQ